MRGSRCKCAGRVINTQALFFLENKEESPVLSSLDFFPCVHLLSLPTDLRSSPRGFFSRAAAAQPRRAAPDLSSAVEGSGAFTQAIFYTTQEAAGVVFGACVCVCVYVCVCVGVGVGLGVGVTRQDKPRQAKTRQDKTRRDKTRKDTCR